MLSDRRTRHLLTALLLTALAGCAPGVGRNVGAQVTSPKAAPKGAPARPASTGPSRTSPWEAQTLTPAAGGGGELVPLPQNAAPAFKALTSATNLTGTITFRAVSDDFFKDSAAAYWLRAVGPAANALVTTSTLAEDLFTSNGKVVTATSAVDGTFIMPGGAPTNRPFVVNAGFARGHRLSALAAAGQGTVEIDEATTMVAEMARWQLFGFAVANDKDLDDLKDFGIANLNTLTRGLLAAMTIPSTGGSAPSVAALRHGAGHELRNLYVEAFASKVTPVGQTSSPVQANSLQDFWEDALGFKPLALTRTAGNGTPGFNQSDGMTATAAQIMPLDAVADHLGNIYMTQMDVGLVSLIPRSPLAGPLLGEDEPTLGVGNVYTLAGVVNGPNAPVDWDLLYRDTAANDLDPEPAPSLVGGFPLFGPQKLLVERAAGSDTLSHLYVTLPFNGRVMFMPTAGVTHFGQNFVADHLYGVVGRGIKLPYDDDDANGFHDPNAKNHWTPAVDGELAKDAGLFFPTAVQRDGAGNLWVLDAGDDTPNSAAIWFVRESDGKIWQLPLLRKGAVFRPKGALDMRLSPDGKDLYVADTERHWVFKVPVPLNLAATPFAAAEITRVTGKPGKAGFLDTSIAGVKFPDIHNVSDGIPDPAGDLNTADDAGTTDPATVTALLNRPGSIAFDGAGDLLIGDTGNGRIRLRKGNELFTIAGGLNTRFITGDSRLAYLPGIGYLNWSAIDGSVLVTDKREAVVRRLHTARGTLRKP